MGNLCCGLNVLNLCIAVQDMKHQCIYKRLILKEKTIMVIYTLRKEEKRVITAYIVRRKKKW